MSLKADIGVFGGSGFYSLLENVQEASIETPFGAPSDSIFLADYGGKRVAFLPRHGRHHTIPPHKINYRANVWAMKSLGVRYLLAPCAVGSLRLDFKPGDFVVANQYVDRTNGRSDTFYEGPEVYHVSAAEPYCPKLRALASEVIREHGIVCHEGALVVIQGPRFSSKAESRWFSNSGFDIIGMTGYPEAHLALEQEIAIVNISLVTDFDCGLEGMTDPVNATEVYEVFKKNAERVKEVALTLIERIPLDLDSPQHHSLKYAKVS